MKNKSLFIVLPTLLFLLTGCGAVETIFKAGMWWALFLVSVVIAVILYIIFRIKRK